jgi:uncharacterized repeat protein (TIGR01451 family)
MKKLYPFLILAFLSFECNAQIVNIPDAAFKNKLVTMGVDTNNDAEIQVNEALAITSLYIGGFENATISDLTGIEAFTNLVELSVYYHHLTTINLSTLTNLQKLSCNLNQITSLDLTGLTNLTFLNCSDNLLTSIDLSPVPNLKSFWCGYNSLTSLDLSNLVHLEDFECGTNMLTALDTHTLVNVTTMGCRQNHIANLDLTGMTSLFQLDCTQNDMTNLDVSNLVNLKYLECQYNLLTSLNVTNLVNLATLQVAGNQLTSLDLTNLTKLKNVNISGNLFTTLDLSHIVLSYPANQWPPYQYNVGDNPNLTYLNIKNGVGLGMLCGGGSCWSSFNAAGSNNLAYICADEFNYQFITTAPNAQVNPYCSFNPGGTYNTISGTLTVDLNNNGCDENDFHFPNGKIQIDNNILNGAAFSNADGNYSFLTQEGTFVISPLLENPYFTVSPPSATITFADSDNHTQAQNFCITANGVHNDVEITILPIGFPRPGFNVVYQLVYKNKGNQVLSGNIDFTFDDAILDFVSANPVLADQSLNNLRWNYVDLLPFESRSIYFTLNVNSPQEIPAVNIGDLLHFTTSINPVSGDETITDNTFALTQMVRGAIDPNDKTCLEGSTIAPEMVGKYLHYVIRFQNSGSAAAENIVVKDLIDTTKFNMASFELTDSSHPHLTKISGNKVEFEFPNINLPAETDDEPGSHGYVAFKLKTKGDLVIGNTVENKADIYFDYNFPIETNTATTIVALLNLNSFGNASVSFAPNPTKNVIHITSKGNITSVQLVDVQGRILETMTANEEQLDFDLSQKAGGVYFVKIWTDKGVKVVKVIKE